MFQKSANKVNLFAKVNPKVYPFFRGSSEVGSAAKHAGHMASIWVPRLQVPLAFEACA